MTGIEAGQTPARIARAEAETRRLGELLAPHLALGDVVALMGPLGAGKTCFVAGLAHGLGYGSRVRSPSFSLVNEYTGRILLVHLDLYRLAAGEVESLGLEEYLERGALAVEWGERLPARWRGDALELSFEIVGQARRIRATAQSGRGIELCSALGAAFDLATAEAEEP